MCSAKIAVPLPRLIGNARTLGLTVRTLGFSFLGGSSNCALIINADEWKSMVANMWSPVSAYQIVGF